MLAQPLILLRLVCGAIVLVFLSGCQAEIGEIVVKLDSTVYNTNLSPYYFQQFPLEEQQKAFKTILFGHNGPQIVSVKAGDVIWGKVRFRLGLIDMNDDSTFNQQGVDLLFLGDYGQPMAVLREGVAHLGPVRKRSFIQVDRDYFEVVQFPSTGQALRLRPLDHRPTMAPIARIRTTFAALPAKNWADETVYLRQDATRQQALLILVWSLGPDQGQLIRDLDEWNANGQDSIEILTINMLDAPNRLQDFLQEYHIQLPVYRASPATCETLDCHAQLPFAIYIGADGQIIRRGLEAASLRELLGLPPREEG